jgi:CheY-like chemotaxis protein
MAETVHLQEHVACIILDLGLHDRNDTTLLKTLSHHPDYIETPIIVHTGRSLDSSGKAEVMRYADCLIDKGPESIPALMRELRRLACFYKFAVHSSLNLDAGASRY